MKQSLERGEDVLISGFGRFCVRRKHQRTGRNPQTGESMPLPSRTVVTFKCSGVLKEKINREDPRQSVKAGGSGSLSLKETFRRPAKKTLSPPMNGS